MTGAERASGARGASPGDWAVEEVPPPTAVDGTHLSRRRERTRTALLEAAEAVFGELAAGAARPLREHRRRVRRGPEPCDARR